MSFGIDIEKIKEKLMKQKNYTADECDKKAEEIVNSIHEYSAKLHAEKEQDYENYQQLWAERNYYKEQVSIWESNMATNPNAKAKYEQSVKLFDDAELNADIARDRFNHTNSFAGKIGTQAIIASSILC